MALAYSLLRLFASQADAWLNLQKFCQAELNKVSSGYGRWAKVEYDGGNIETQIFVAIGSNVGKYMGAFEWTFIAAGLEDSATLALKKRFERLLGWLVASVLLPALLSSWRDIGDVNGGDIETLLKIVNGTISA